MAESPDDCDEDPFSLKEDLDGFFPVQKDQKLSPRVQRLVQDEFEVEYPEVLVQETEKANGLYVSLQRNSRQFTESAGEQVRTATRWKGSNIEMALGQIVNRWHGLEYEGGSSSTGLAGGNVSGYDKGMKTAPNGLFNWSSGESYIQSRKKELLMRGKLSILAEFKSNSTQKQREKESTSGGDGAAAVGGINFIEKLKLSQPKASVTNKLNRIVEQESNKFIHARIQAIRAHHSEQISQQIHERKRRDHEEYLHRLKQKEEEYEKSLRATNADGNKAGAGGFFGSLFGFSNSGAKASTSTTELIKTPSSTLASEEPVSDSGKRFSLLPNQHLWRKNSPSNDMKTEKQGKLNTANDLIDLIEETTVSADLGTNEVDKNHGEGNNDDGNLKKNTLASIQPLEPKSVNQSPIRPQKPQQDPISTELGVDDSLESNCTPEPKVLDEPLLEL